MLKRVGFSVVGGGIYIYLSLVFDELFGNNSLILVILAIFAAAALIQSWRNIRIKKEISKIAADDSRAVRFDGDTMQTQRAAEIGAALRWHVERIEHADPNKASVRFTPTDSSSTPNDLLQALFDAGIARTVNP